MTDLFHSSVVLCLCFVFDFVCLFVRFLVNFDIFLFQHGNKDEDIVEQSADNVLKVDVVGLMFIIFFLFILFVQFFGMIVHRSDVLFEEQKLRFNFYSFIIERICYSMHISFKYFFIKKTIVNYIHSLNQLINNGLIL